MSFARLILCSAALALAIAPASARAQSAPPGASPGGAPSQAAVKKATDAFQQGAKLFQAKKFALALEQFKTSYETVSSPNSLLFIARCHAEMGDVKEAYRTFERVIKEAEARLPAEQKYVPTRDSAKVEIEEVATKIALLTIGVGNAKDSSRVRVGGAILPREDWGRPMPHDPGPVEVVLETDGVDPVTERVELAKGDKKTVELAVPEPKVAPPPVEPTPEPPSGPSPLLVGALVAGGIGVIGMGMFGVAGGMSLSTYSEVEDKCGSQPGGKCTSSTDHETIDRGEREQLIANVGLVIGGVGLATGATLLIVDLATAGDAPSQPAEAAKVRVDVAPGYVGVRGSF